MPDLPSGTVIFLFTDIEGSTQLWERGRLAMAQAVERHIALLDVAIRAHGGVHFKTVGDAVQAAFPTAPQAVAAAVAGQRALLAEDWGDIGSLKVRMAMHAGESIPDARGDYLAAPLNRLSRLLSTGYGSQILLSQTVQQLSRGGLPPEVELRDLGEHRLRDLLEPERVFQLLHPELPADFPALKSLDIHPNNLPLQPTSFLGREAVVQDIANLLQRSDVRLLTLTGPGGTGKTRLALHVVAEHLDDFADGVFFVPLASLTDPGLVPSAIAEALGIREEGSQPLEERLRDSLSSKALLLILDNFEHLSEAAPLVADLLTSAPNLKILITSRVPLRLRAEQEYPVPSLGLPRRRPPLTADEATQYEALRLFVARAQAITPSFNVDNETAPAVAEICHRLDGLPLAIELAAARVRILSPQAMLARLEQRLPLLTGGARDAPHRQRTLRNTIAWSYDLLEPDEQQLFRRFAVFAGGASFEAVEAVANPDGDLDIFGGLERLVEHSLLRQGDGSDGESRFTMLETIREFAQDELARSGEDETVRLAHATHFRTMAEQAEPELRGSSQAVWIAHLETELPNLRAVLDWSLASGEAETGLRLAGALYWFWFLRNHVSEGRTWFERARAAATQPAAAAGKAALGAALLALRAQEYGVSKDFAEHALERFQACEDQWGIAMVIHHLGHMADDLDHDMTRAAALLEESLQQFQAIGDPWGIAYSQRCLAEAQLAATHDYDRATILLHSAVTTFRAIGDHWNTGVTLHRLGDAAREYERWSEAIAAYQESLSYHWTERDALGVADALLRLAQILVAVGNMELAVRFFGCAEAQHEQAGVTLYEPIRHGYEQASASARSTLGRERFEALWEVGRAMPLDETVDAVATIRIDLPLHGGAVKPSHEPAVSVESPSNHAGSHLR
jgi:predicted ATPase/class 3 adenylate cyclase